ncbi:hypothetical protein BIV57_02265 [Mangrovactinospora gilvigrisea]|uniref:HAMP domain-containing protein n=1 Tax=Mangrovactinospora gilvigrisea TaxID=1428644 RepID=A0A1J7C016_9ACTN|nr:hypothetical protein [Mangrovactinospora gilvigrisea]OIV39073.1 hypothetical protein BIV57_02265 [Mangrovactinospora gilvigrisea]
MPVELPSELGPVLARADAPWPAVDEDAVLAAAGVARASGHPVPAQRLAAAADDLAQGKRALRDLAAEGAPDEELQELSDALALLVDAVRELTGNARNPRGVLGYPSIPIGSGPDIRPRRAEGD